MPYASWAVIVVQLGFGCYELLSLYRRYCAQARSDIHNGVDRTLEETMELVVKPKRRKPPQNPIDDGPTEEMASSRGDSSCKEIRYPQLSISAWPSSCDFNQPEQSTSDSTQQNSSTYDSNQIKPPASDSFHQEQSTSEFSQLDNDKENSSVLAGTENNELQCAYDSRMRPLSEHGQGTDTTSICTSIESTDSNKGIIKDMYNECYVCALPLDDIKKPVATLPFCMHPFHKSCLDGVLRWHQKCPICDVHIFSAI